MKAKAIILTVACAAAVFSLTACNTPKKTTDTTPISTSDIANNTSNEDNVQIANPWTACDTLADAEKIAGFNLEIPTSVDRYDIENIQAISKEIIEINYQHKEKTDEYITIRKGIGSEDISGDYNEYEETKDVAVGTYEVTLKSNSGKVMLAVWTSGDYSYSVYTSGMSEDEIIKIAEQMK